MINHRWGATFLATGLMLGIAPHILAGPVAFTIKIPKGSFEVKQEVKPEEGVLQMKDAEGQWMPLTDDFMDVKGKETTLVMNATDDKRMDCTIVFRPQGGGKSWGRFMFQGKGNVGLITPMMKPEDTAAGFKRSVTVEVSGNTTLTLIQHRGR